MTSTRRGREMTERLCGVVDEFIRTFLIFRQSPRIVPADVSKSLSKENQEHNARSPDWR